MTHNCVSRIQNHTVSMRWKDRERKNSQKKEWSTRVGKAEKTKNQRRVDKTSKPFKSVLLLGNDQKIDNFYLEMTKKSSKMLKKSEKSKKAKKKHQNKTTSRKIPKSIE